MIRAIPFAMIAFSLLSLGACRPSGQEPFVPGFSGAGESGSFARNSAPSRKRDGCKATSECLLSFGLNGDSDAPPLVKVRKIDDGEAIELASVEGMMGEFKGGKTSLSELELFLGTYEPGSGLMVDDLGSSPPVPARKATRRASAAIPSAGVSKVAAAPAEDISVASVKKLRMGEHSRYTRIVLDLDHEARATARVDNEGRMLVVDLPGASWGTQEKWYSDTPPLVMAYLAKPLPGGGTRLIIRLKEDAKLVHEEFLAAGDYPLHRLILDVQSPRVHKL